MDRQTVDHYLLMALLGAVLTLAMQYAGLEKKVDQLVCQFREQCAPAAEEAKENGYE